MKNQNLNLEKRMKHQFKYLLTLKAGVAAAIVTKNVIAIKNFMLIN